MHYETPTILNIPMGKWLKAQIPLETSLDVPAKETAKAIAEAESLARNQEEESYHDGGLLFDELLQE